MKAPRTRPTYGYERVASVLAAVLAVAMVAAGLYVAVVALTFVVAMSHFGSNK